MRVYSLSLVILLSFVISCSSSDVYIEKKQSAWESRPTPSSGELVYEVFLVGDGGAPQFDGDDPVFNLLNSMTVNISKNSAVVFLGDNLYPAGLPDSLDPKRSYYEKRLTTQLDAIKDSKARIVFVPGNHDWDDGGQEGLERVRRQEEFIESYLDQGNTFLPDDGFPGPHEVKLLDADDVPGYDEDIRLLAIDTQWWLHKHEKPFGDTGEYDLHDPGNFLNELEDILRKRRKDNIIMAAHHPLFSNGSHGGRLPASTHFKPPVFGSIYALYRRFLGLEQDIVHHKYRELKESLMPILTQQPDLIYASGHDHNLQLFEQRARIDQYYIVSGSASKETYTANGRGSSFNYDKKGFAKLNYYLDGSIWVEFWAPIEDGSRGKLLFRTQLKAPREQFPEPDPVFEETLKDSVAIVAANPEYNRGTKFTRFFIGEHRRDAWSIPVSAPVFDIEEEKSGLEAIRLGGRGQSNSLHLEDSLSRKYVLRSVDKVAGKIWDENLRKTAALRLAQDQFSYIHPYAAFIIPPLADAAGIYHTNPKLFYIPGDPALGEFGQLEKGKLALFEEKPDNDMSHEPSVGRSEEVLSWRQMIREVEGDIDHRIDQRLMARSRLFDMWISDWDRHFDQWRWAAFEPADKKGKIYKPIPRDRDVAFMKMDKLPSLAKLGPFFQYQDFRESYGNIKGLTLNSLGLTRRFTNQLTREDWLGIADSLQMQLTDEVIDDAVKVFPEKVYERYGSEISRLLKIRRDKLSQVALTYYDLQTAVVSIPGSNKREEYIVTKIDESTTRVQVYKITKKGERRGKYYDRTFGYDETQEIRLYALGGDDVFRTEGVSNSKIKILMIGGPGEDEFNDSTPKKGRKDFKAYDTDSGNVWNVERNTKRIVSDDPLINQYNYEKDFQYNRLLPLLFVGGNNDDGFLFGGGIKFARNEFRKTPASIHTIKANHSIYNSAFNVIYQGEWFGLLSARSFILNAEILSPNNFRNFFGLGNETEQTVRNIKFYRAQLSQYILAPSIKFKELNAFDFTLGPRLQITDVSRDPNGFLNDPQLGISDKTFDDQWFAGFEASLSLYDVDNHVNPKQGFSFSTDARFNFGIRNLTDDFSKLTSELKLFLSPSLVPQLTIANRVGMAHNFGEFPFYESNALGGRHNLRGFRSTRFAGRSSVYHNLELRAELFDVYRYIFAGRFGLNAFMDTGRVWTDGENSSIWHQGFGGGIWFDFLGFAVLNFDYGLSEEDEFYSFGLGFFF